jgi:hypothetical protein
VDPRGVDRHPITAIAEGGSNCFGVDGQRPASIGDLHQHNIGGHAVGRLCTIRFRGCCGLDEAMPAVPCPGEPAVLARSAFVGLCGQFRGGVGEVHARKKQVLNPPWPHTTNFFLEGCAVGKWDSLPRKLNSLPDCRCKQLAAEVAWWDTYLVDVECCWSICS